MLPDDESHSSTWRPIRKSTSGNLDKPEIDSPIGHHVAESCGARVIHDEVVSHASSGHTRIIHQGVSVGRTAKVICSY